MKYFPYFDIEFLVHLWYNIYITNGQVLGGRNGKER